MSSRKRIAVVGGGFCGMGSIKSLKEEGLDCVCYEKTSVPGGTWTYREQAEDGVPSIMPTTIINHSKEMGSISNFVPPKECPNYMRHDEMLKLFWSIAEQFDCLKHMVYNSEVVSVKRCHDYDETGRWTVVVKNTVSGEVTTDVFDGVMVCVGHITYPKMPEMPGMDKFGGKIMHTHSLKNVDSFRGKRVIVLGIGCSGLDAAAEISSVASQVYISSRNGAWILPRVGPFGLPFDYAILRRFTHIAQSMFGYKFASWMLETLQVNKRFNHTLYNLKPDYPVLGKDPSINDVIPSKILSGSVILKKNIKCFTEKGVIFEGESKVTEADVIIMATGYKWQFPFLEEGIMVTEENKIDLYRCVYPPHLKHSTLAIIGFILPFGPGFPLGELQCRWAAHMFKGHGKLPSEAVMREEIDKRYEENSKRYPPSDKMSIRVDFIPYMDGVASEFGVLPNFWKLLFTDYTLFKALIFGPSLPYQYRLVGPGKWDGARDAILTAYERVRFPLSGDKKVGQKKKKPSITEGFLFKYMVIFMLMTFWLFQTEISIKYCILALLLPYIMTWKGFYMKYFFAMLLLPFFVTWEGFVSSYMLTIFAPLLLTTISCLM